MKNVLIYLNLLFSFLCNSTYPVESPNAREGLCLSSFPLWWTTKMSVRFSVWSACRCVKENFGYVGCSRDVLGYLDALCSGRKSCKVRVLDETFAGIKPCHDDLKSYLSAQYTCIQGASFSFSFSRTGIHTSKHVWQLYSWAGNNSRNVCSVQHVFSTVKNLKKRVIFVKKRQQTWCSSTNSILQI